MAATAKYPLNMLTAAEADAHAPMSYINVPHFPSTAQGAIGPSHQWLSPGGKVIGTRAFALEAGLPTDLSPPLPSPLAHVA